MAASAAQGHAGVPEEEPDDLVDAADDAAEELADNAWLERAARAGFVMSGIVHMIIGWTAIRISMGAGGDADQSGALRAFTTVPGGRVLLGIGALMMVALAVWYLLDAWYGAPRDGERTDIATHAVKHVAKGIVYAVLGVTAARFALGAESDSGQQSSSLTAFVMGLPLGRAAIVAVGLGILGVGVYHVYSGLTRRFEKGLDGHRREDVDKTVLTTGLVGYIAKGIALIAVGVLFTWAAIVAKPEEATGMDGALTKLVAIPLGEGLLVAVGVGLIVFGLYSLLRSRYARL